MSGFPKGEKLYLWVLLLTLVLLFGFQGNQIIAKPVIILLLAIPIPLLLGFAGWALQQTSSPSDWLRGLAGGLEFATKAMFTTVFLATVCRPGGLGTSHFGWNQEMLARFRTAIYRFLNRLTPAQIAVLLAALGASIMATLYAVTQGPL